MLSAPQALLPEHDWWLTFENKTLKGPLSSSSWGGRMLWLASTLSLPVHFWDQEKNTSLSCMRSCWNHEGKDISRLWMPWAIPWQKQTSSFFRSPFSAFIFRHKGAPRSPCVGWVWSLNREKHKKRTQTCMLSWTQFLVPFAEGDLVRRQFHSHCPGC